MGIFYNKPTAILEKKASVDVNKETPVEDDETNYTMDDGETPEGAEDTTVEDDPPEDDETNYTMDDDEVPEDGEEETQENIDGEAETDTGGGTETDYSMDDTDIGGEEGGEDTETDMPTDDGMGEEEEVDPDQEMKDLEKELNGSLSDKQVAIKNRELKKQYVQIYNTASEISERIEKIVKNQDNITIIDFCLNKIFEMKKLIYDYITNTFDTKTSIENSINIKQYLVTLASINKLLEEIKPKKK